MHGDSRIWIALALSALTANSGFANTPPTGLRAYAEIWNPAKVDGESLKTLENSPTLLSDTLTKVWTAFGNWYQTSVPALLHKQDFLHTVDSNIPTGITLYSRGHDMTQPPSLTLPANPDLTLTPQGANGFTALFHVPSSSISLCSTTPDVPGIHIGAGKWADPCLTASVDLFVTVTISISDSPGHLLQVTNAVVNTGNFQYGNEDLSAEAAVVVTNIISFFGGPDYQKMLVAAVDSQRQNVTADLQGPVDTLNAQIQSYEQLALGEINKALAPAASLTSLIHVALWEQSTSHSQMLTLLLAPPTGGVTLNASQLTGQFTGTLNFDASVQAPPASCAAIGGSQFTAQAQVGPRPVQSIDAHGTPAYGKAPTQKLAITFAGGPLQGRQCSYAFGHLAIGLPNVIDFDSGQPSNSSIARLQTALDIKPDKWANPVVVGPGGVVLSTGVPTNQLAGDAFGRNPVAQRANGAPAQTWNSGIVASVAQGLTGKNLNLIASAVNRNLAGVVQQSAHAPAQSLKPATPIAWGAQGGAMQSSAQPASAPTAAVPTWGAPSALRSAQSQQLQPPPQQQIQQQPLQQSLQRPSPAMAPAPSSLPSQ